MTSGIASGPGPGPEALPMAFRNTGPQDELRALWRAYPEIDELREIVAELDGGF